MTANAWLKAVTGLETVSSSKFAQLKLSIKRFFGTAESQGSRFQYSSQEEKDHRQRKYALGINSRSMTSPGFIARDKASAPPISSASHVVGRKGQSLFVEILSAADSLLPIAGSNSPYFPRPYFGILL